MPPARGSRAICGGHGHARGREHAIGLPAAGLLEMVDDIAGPLLAEHLVEFLASRRIGVADDKQQGVVHAFGRVGRGAEIGLRLRGKHGLARVEVHVRRAFDIIFVDVTHPAAQRFRRRCLFGKALIGADMDHRRGPQVFVLEVDLARHQAPVPLQRLDRDGQAVEQRIGGQLVAVETQKSTAGLDPGVLVDDDDHIVAVGGRDSHPVAAARGDDAFDLGSPGHFGRRRRRAIYGRHDVAFGCVLRLRGKAAGRRSGEHRQRQ